MANNWTVPNFISGARLICVPVLAWAMLVGQIELFRWLLVGMLVSDILDGWIARTFKMETKLGSILDAMADTLTYFVAAASLFLLKWNFLVENWIPIAVVLATFTAEKIKCYVHYRRWFNSFHTYTAKTMAYIQGLWIVLLYFDNPIPVLFWIAVVVGTWSNIEDMILSSLLKKDDHDVKGLYWVLRQRKSSSFKS